MISKRIGTARIKPYQWQLAFASFIVAAVTGVLYRIGMIGSIPVGLGLENIRHAHSHLMFFSWAVPLPLYFMLAKIRGENREITIRWISGMATGSLLLGWLAYPFFLFYGYQPVSFGEIELPVSVMLSGLVMICWYGFMAGYRKIREQMRPDASCAFYDAALVMLFISSLGAWGVAVLQAVGSTNPLYGKALTHFFLSTFTEGWVVLILLGIIFDRLKVDFTGRFISPQLLTGLIAVGAPLTFAYGISKGLLSNGIMLASRAGGGLAAIGLLLSIYVIVKRNDVKKTVWIWPIAVLAVKGIMQLFASVIPAEFWMSIHALRILYLHVLLLGGYSLGIIAAVHFKRKIRDGFYHATAWSVVLLLVSLLLILPIWPIRLAGPWIGYLLSGAAILPAISVSVQWIKLKNSEYEAEDYRIS